MRKLVYQALYRVRENFDAPGVMVVIPALGNHMYTREVDLMSPGGKFGTPESIVIGEVTHRILEQYEKDGNIPNHYAVYEHSPEEFQRDYPGFMITQVIVEFPDKPIKSTTGEEAAEEVHNSLEELLKNAIFSSSMPADRVLLVSLQTKPGENGSTIVDSVQIIGVMGKVGDNNDTK